MASKGDKTCATCQHHGHGVCYGEGWCMNPMSTYYEYYTPDWDKCKEWEEREDEDA